MSGLLSDSGKQRMWARYRHIEEINLEQGLIISLYDKLETDRIVQNTNKEWRVKPNSSAENEDVTMLQVSAQTPKKCVGQYSQENGILQLTFVLFFGIRTRNIRHQ